MPLTTSSIIPNMSRRLRATFTPDQELASGVYSVKTEVTLDDGTSIDQGEGSFEITGSGVSIPATTPPATTPPATTPPTTPAATNWTLIGGIIGGVIIVVLLVVIGLLLKRRRTY
ncbi:hypothetical protein ES703_85279 [subsurface metagenome]